MLGTKIAVRKDLLITPVPYINDGLHQSGQLRQGAALDELIFIYVSILVEALIRGLCTILTNK